MTPSRRHLSNAWSRTLAVLLSASAAAAPAASCASGQSPTGSEGGVQGTAGAGTSTGGSSTSTGGGSSTSTGGGSTGTGGSSTGSGAGGTGGGDVDAGPPPGWSCNTAIDITAAVANGGTYSGAATVPSLTASSCSNQNAPKSYLKLTVTTPGNYDVKVSTAAGTSNPHAPDAAVFIRSICDQGGSEVTCNDTAAYFATHVGLSLQGDVFIVLDGAWFSPGYDLQVVPTSSCTDDLDCSFYSPQIMCIDATGICTSPYQCPLFFDDCDGNPANTCEASLWDDVANCGACGYDCLAQPHVVTATCDNLDCYADCEPGWAHCYEPSNTPCETELLNNVADCGGCGFGCLFQDNVQAATCNAGVCDFTCDPGFEDCNGLEYDGCESLLAADPVNCGGCGVDCGGGGCEAGACLPAPTTLASGLMAPFGIALDATTVYFSDPKGKKVLSVPIDGGAVTTLVSGVDQPTYVGVDGGFVHYAVVGSMFNGEKNIYRVPIGGGAPELIVQNHQVGGGFVISNGAAFFQSYAGGSWGIRKLDLTSLVVTDLAMLSSSEAEDIVVDATHVYWTDDWHVHIKKVPIAGGPVVTFPNLAVPQGRGIAVDGTHVYWVNQNPDSNAAWKVPLAGGVFVNLASGEPADYVTGPRYVALSDGFLYFGNDNAKAGWIRKVSTSGGPVSSVAGKQKAPMQLAVDGTHVYWTDKLAGTVMKVAK